MNKQAILIMYHNDFYVLEKLLRQIDSKYFDIYLHVDKKVKEFDFDYVKGLLKESDIYFTKRIDVKWSTYSQIECELLLLTEAAKQKYMYYHLISGNDLLLKEPKIIYDFYKKNYNKEFVGYQDIEGINESQLERIKYYHFFNQNRRNNNALVQRISSKIYYHLLSIEKKLKIDRLKNCDLTVRKGTNWVSITDELVKYVLSKRKLIKQVFSYSNCADELFIQTLVYNSKFINNIYNNYNDEHKNVKRAIDWKRGEPYTYTISDYELLVNGDCFFARKFSSIKDKNIIDKIYEATKGK